VQSLLELPGFGAQVIAEVLSGAPREFATLTADEQREAARNAQSKISNPFEYWLRLKGELMNRDLPSLDTPAGIFERFVGSTA
jgi:hypothetical protein